MFPKDEMLGFCSACGERIITLGKKPRFLDNYREHFIELSNKTIMKVGVCADCRVSLVAGDAKGKADLILANHKEYWANRTKKTKKTTGRTTKMIPRFFEDLTVENPNTTPRDFRRALEKRLRGMENKQFMSN